MTSINAPVAILDLTPVQLKDFIRSLGEPAANTDLLLKYIYCEYAAAFEEMARLPPSMKRKLAQQAVLYTMEPLDERVSADGQTRKALLRLADGRTIESAEMSFCSSGGGRERRTVCVSSQVGCPVGCRFCATGQQGFERNLTPGEIIGQVLFFSRRYGREHGEMTDRGNKRSRITNVVFMGMGEPLANYQNVRQAIAILNSPKGMGLGFHQVTLSTAGLVSQILQLAGENLQFQLAVSLHAASNELRSRLVPINKKYPLEHLIPACREFAAATGRKIFIEYALFDGVNDAIKDAEALLRLLEGLDCSVNLITGNPTASAEFQPSSRETALCFQKRLIDGGIRTMLRVPRGADIEAGCGQLRSRWLADKSCHPFA